MSFPNFSQGIHNIMMKHNARHYVDPIDYYLSRKKKKTEPVVVDQTDQYIIEHMMENSSVFKIEQNDFESAALEMGVKIKFNNAEATKEMTREVNDIWMKEIRCFARRWYLSFGLIPYSFNSEYNSKFKVPRIKDPTTGQIMVFYDISKKSPKYLWISNFPQENSSTLRSEHSAGTTKYDGTVHFFVVKGESPDYMGKFRSPLRHLIPKYIQMIVAKEMKNTQDKMRTFCPFVIEEQLPNSMEQMKLMEKLDQVKIRRNNAVDLRQQPQFAEENQPITSPVYSQTTSHSENQVVSGDGSITKTKTYGFKITDRQPTGPYVKNGRIKLLPGQIYKKYDIQKLEIDHELIKEEFQRMMSALMGSVFKPWEKERHKSVSDAYLISAQRFVNTSVSRELKILSGLVKEWYIRAYGHPHLELFNLTIRYAKRKKNIHKKSSKWNTFKGQFNVKPPKGSNIIGKKRKRDNEGDEEYNETNEFPKKKKRKKMKMKKYPRSTILNDKNTDLLSLVLNLKVEFIKQPFIVRPGLDGLRELYYAGVISDTIFTKAMATIYGLPLSEITPEKLFEGSMKQQGQWIDKEALKEELKVRHMMSQVQKATMNQKTSFSSTKIQPSGKQLRSTTPFKGQQSKPTTSGQKDKLYLRRRKIQ